MSLRTFLKPLSFIPALVLMYLIYTFSAQEGDVSSALSYKASVYMVRAADEILDAGLQDWEIENFANRFHGVVRKLAHMTEYFALAVAVSFPLYVYGLHGILLMLTAGMICVAYACGDEYHQSMVVGRMASKKDVLIDSFGVFWGIILVRIIGWAGRKTIFRPLRRKRRESFPEYYPEDDYLYDEPYFEDEIPPSAYPPPEPSRGSRRVSSYYNTAPQQSGEPVQGSDRLSEDLSFRKLIHDIREQHQQENER